MPHKEIIIEDDKEKQLLEEVNKKTDAEGKRLARFLAMPDLSRTNGSPLYEVVQRTLKVKGLEDFHIIKVPEIVSTDILFDLFNMPPGHPARSKSDTYYVNDKYVLRTHDTVFWYYYLNQPEIKERIKNKQSFGAICFGKVYRKDEIDRKHMNVFHQMGGLYLAADGKETVKPEDLKEILSKIARAIFGEETKFRFYDHNFPYTDPSFEMEAFINDNWMEMVGSGQPRKSVLKNFGLEGYHGWAFGFGLERLAMASMDLPDIRLLWSDDKRVKKQLKLGHHYKEVSIYPPITRDISFVVSADFVPNDYFDLIRDIGGDLVEEVQLLDKYEDEKKFGKGKLSYTYRVIYRSNERTLKTEEIEPIQAKIEAETKAQFKGVIR
ncbi:MAG: hypothetical protein HYS87_00160 [Candidatus Colwellbacteria bacterium]|nr:hypothetical protein [Candidatus Colwellbacteria bacterium]